jgi:predicted RNase H-like HicB family nuclease
MKVTALVSRSEGWWAVEVPEAPGVFTQARELSEVPAMVRDAVALMTGVDEEDVEVTVRDVTDTLGAVEKNRAAGLRGRERPRRGEQE